MYILDEKISDMKSEYTKVERGEKRTTYSLDWDTIVGLESRLLRDFIKERSITKGRDLSVSYTHLTLPTKRIV